MTSPNTTTALDWLVAHDANILRGLADLVAIPSISNDGRHGDELDRSAALVADQMRAAGLHDVEVLRIADSYPYVYGQRLDAPGKPTVFLYAHHDVQPINYEERWLSDPWTLTPRDGRLYGRGSADDKAAISCQLAAIAALVNTRGRLPVNVKVLVEGEEEIGSGHLAQFFQTHRQRIASDVVVVTDTENIQAGMPSLTYSLRGVVTARVRVEGLALPVHSGMCGGALPDAALALNVILSRLYWANGQIDIPGLYDRVRPMTAAERAAAAALPLTDDQVRQSTGMLEGTHFANEAPYNFAEATSRRPSVTVIAQRAANIDAPSNQVLPFAEALVSVRTVADQRGDEVLDALRRRLTADPPWGVRVSVEPEGPPVEPWMTDPTGPAFSAAVSALHRGYGVQPTMIGCGGSIGFVGPLCDLLGGAPALLLGIEDPHSNAHAPNESLHAGDFRKLTASLVHLFDELAALPALR